jgi:hypothetical protein
MEASKAYTDGVKIGASVELQDQRRRDLLTVPRGTRRTVGTSLIRALVWNVGTLRGMIRENPISEVHERGEVSMPVKGADHPVVVMKFL